MKKKLKKGFTLVELVIVIAVIAILSAVLIPTFGNVISNANDSAAFSTASNALTKYTTNQAQAGQSTMLPDGYVIVFDKEQEFTTSTSSTQITESSIKYVFEFKNGSLIQYKDDSTKTFNKYSEIKDKVVALNKEYKSTGTGYAVAGTSDTKQYPIVISTDGKTVTYFGAYVLDGVLDNSKVSGKVLLLAKADNGTTQQGGQG